MAEIEIEIKFTWENGKDFTMTSTEDGGDVLTIAKISENGHFDDLWNSVQSVCEIYAKGVLTRIGDEMKA